jgi:hypothetical protein
MHDTIHKMRQPQLCRVMSNTMFARVQFYYRGTTIQCTDSWRFSMLVVVLLLEQHLFPLVYCTNKYPSLLYQNASDYGVPASRRDA